jgi:PII-like signaling protein
LAGEIVHRAHRAGLAGATTVQGIQGFGRERAIHSAPRWRIVDRTPVMLQIIDTAERLRAFLPELDDLADDVLIVCDAVDVVAPLPMDEP